MNGDDEPLESHVSICPKGHVHVTLNLQIGVLSANSFDYELTPEEAVMWANTLYAAVRAATGGN